MIAEKNNAVAVETNMGGFQATRMGIVEGGEAFVVGLVTDLYADQIGAVIREYATNARDGQLENGVDAPIEVSLPTALTPLYTIKDRGCGLTATEMREVYAQYGGSTKRGNASANGFMGIGSKSALTYTHQFTVVSVKDGVRTTGIISRIDDDLPQIVVVDESATADPSGTEVQVPVKRDDFMRFDQKAVEFFKFWDANTVLVNGHEPAKMRDRADVLKLNNDMIIVPNRGLEQNTIIMGGVAYPADLPSPLDLPYGSFLATWVPTGSVRPNPPREGLMTTSGTRAALAKVCADYKTGIANAVQNDVDLNASSHAEALQIALRWGKTVKFDRTTVTFKGAAIPNRFEPQDEFVTAPGDSDKMSAHDRHARWVQADQFDSTVFVYAYDRPSFTATQKKKLVKWVEDNHPSTYVRRFALLTEKPDSPFIDPKLIIDWPTVDAIKLPRKQVTASGRIPGSYDFYEGTLYRHGVEDTEIDTSYPVYYHVGRNASPYAKMLATDSPDFTLVVLTTNRVDKFKRNFPNATRAQDAVKGLWEKWCKTLTQDQRMALVVQDHYHARRILGRLDVTKVKDPAFKEMQRLNDLDLSQVNQDRNAFRYVSDATITGLPTFVSPFNRYPLVTQVHDFRHMDHLVLYMNAAYDAMTPKP